MLKFAIIIPVRDITDSLKESIEHIKLLEYKNFECLIVTDYPSDSNYISDKRFRFIDSAGNGNPAFKRNLGAQNTNAEILVFLDDDAYPKNDWLNFPSQYFTEQTNYALGGPALTPVNAQFWEKISGYILQSSLASGFTTYRHKIAKQTSINDYPSVNLFVRKSAFDAVGGFRLDFWPGEDTKLCLDLVTKYNATFVYSPLPVVYHHRRKTFFSYLTQISRYAKHRGTFARIYPKNSRYISYFLPSIFTIGLILGFFSAKIHYSLYMLYCVFMYVYCGLLVFAMLQVIKDSRSLKISLITGFGIFMTHIVYGIYFMYGFISTPKLKLRAVDENSGNYVGG